MRVVIQKVSKAVVCVDNKDESKIKEGLLILLGVHIDDEKKDCLWLANKIASLRIFPDQDQIMNKSIVDIDGEIIVVSQFTLHAKTKKGNRPSYMRAAKTDKAILLYEQFKLDLSNAIGKEVKSGKFGSHMQVTLTNEGPVTIIIDTRKKE